MIDAFLPVQALQNIEEGRQSKNGLEFKENKVDESLLTTYLANV